jgi:hypothetical protein
VQVNFAAGRAEMHVQNLAMEDYFKLPNALADGSEVDATASFDVVWSGPVTRRLNVPDGTNGDRFAGEFVENQASVTWSGSNELGFRFTANPGDFSTTARGRAFAELGHERNGIFDAPDGDPGSAAPALLGALPPAASPPVQPIASAVAPGGPHLAPRPAGGEGRHLTGGVAGTFRAKVGAAARTAAMASAATALFTEIGQQGLDILSR